jgi:hypothetical protein
MKFDLSTMMTVALLAFSANAFANDGSIPYIKVNNVTTTVKNNQTIKFSGGDAYNFFKALPNAFVYDTIHSLTIFDAKKSIEITCTSMDKNDESKQDPKNTSCTISIGAALTKEDLENGDSGVWEGPQVCKE